MNTACMCVWNQTPTVCTPSSAHKSTVAVWNKTINGFAPMSSSEVKLLCLEPDRLRVVSSIACNVICSVLGNARITLGSQPRGGGRRARSLYATPASPAPPPPRF